MALFDTIYTTLKLKDWPVASIRAMSSYQLLKAPRPKRLAYYTHFSKFYFFYYGDWKNSSCWLPLNAYFFGSVNENFVQCSIPNVDLAVSRFGIGTPLLLF